MSDNHQVPVSVFEQGGPNPYGKFFTGETLLSMLVEPNDGVFNCPIGNVTFRPGARTNWHKHSGGQILLVLEGLGRYCERGGTIRILRPGDVVKIPPKSNTGTGRTSGSAWCTSRSKPTSRTTRPNGLNP